MQIRVLGCSGAIAAGHRTSSFLLDGCILFDAGSGVGDLTLAELLAVDHIFVTHSHLDHVLAIGLLADSVARGRSAQGRPPVQVHALPETLQVLRQHIFNDLVWPDFTRLPRPQAPVLALQPLATGEVLEIGGRRIEALPARHTVPALGYAVHEALPGGAWVYTGDTGPNPALWQRLAQLRVGALVIETAFGNDEHALAELSQHLCPARLQGELERLAAACGPTEVYITHIKPGEHEAVMSEIAALQTPHRISALVTGQLLGEP